MLTMSPDRPLDALPAGALRRALHVVSPPLAGHDVLDFQEGLRGLGYSPGPRDGVYGTATAAAVREFQEDQGLGADGVLGPRTREALETAEPRPRPLGSAVGLKALAEALRHVGEREASGGSHRTKFGRWFGVDGVPWCSIFVSYCFAVGAGYTLCAGFGGAGVYARGCTYVPTIEAWLRAAGMWVGRTTPRAGDIVIFDWDGAGIVEQSLGGGRFISCEGNTALGNDADGGAVMRRERYVSQVHGFGRVR